MTSNTTFSALGEQKYVRLTTFRRDGTPVPTPVWLVADGPDHLVITTVNTGKVKRLRHTPRVLLAVSDQRGRVAPGVADVEATAVVVEDAAAVARLQGLILAKYGLFGRIALLAQRLRRSKGGSAVEIRISPPAM